MPGQFAPAPPGQNGAPAEGRVQQPDIRRDLIDQLPLAQKHIQGNAAVPPVQLSQQSQQRHLRPGPAHGIYDKQNLLHFAALAYSRHTAR